MQQFTDQTGRTVSLAHWPPRRIVSLVPSQTELLSDLDLNDEVVGITKFCVHPPEWFQQKNRVGGTKTVRLEKVEALRPDLIIANKEENEREQVTALAEQFPVWISDVKNRNDACEMIRSIGSLTGKQPLAIALTKKIDLEFAAHQPLGSDRRPKVAYFIWRKPYMVAAGETFVDAMLREAGFENVFAGVCRYPEIRLDDLTARQPEVIFLSSEPFPFSEKHFGPFREACPQATVAVVDGELFSWYGSRLQFAPAYFRQLREKLTLAV